MEMPTTSEEDRSAGGTAGSINVAGAVEVTMNDLDRQAARVVRGVVDGQLAVITRHGAPVALIVSLVDAEALEPIEIEGARLDGLRERFAARERRRWWSRILHGRWCNGHGIHGPYRRRR